MQIEQRAGEPAAAPAWCDSNRQDFRLAGGQAGQNKPDQGPADGRAMADDIAIDQQPMKLLLAPAALERRRVQLCDRGGVALPRFREGGLASGR